ncbi:MAG: DUF2812 domain-containing protein [Bacilli bacterium]|nr:DUF2812 domain-containing protein [Bacilli bacterium]
MIKLFHYDIYEYQLLQNKLNQIAKEGYTTDKISYITFFRKNDKPVYYLVDIFTSNEKSILKKREDKQKYIDYYLENDYELISTFKNLLVFKGEKEINPRHFKQNIAEKEINKRLLHFSLALLLFFIILIFFIFPLNIYDLTTNGKILYYVSLILISLAIVYRTLLKWIGIYRFSKKEILYKNLNKNYILSTIFPIITVLLMIIGLVLDVINTTVPKAKPSYIPTLTEYQINEKTEYSIIKHTSILIPESYEYIEYTANQEKSLYSQVYLFDNNEKAQALFKNLLSKPDKLYVDKFKKTSNNEYLGYYENKAYLKLTLQNNMVIIINTTFEIK